jgi:serine/threonine protein kinase
MVLTKQNEQFLKGNTKSLQYLNSLYAQQNSNNGKASDNKHYTTTMTKWFTKLENANVPLNKVHYGLKNETANKAILKVLSIKNNVKKGGNPIQYSKKIGDGLILPHMEACGGGIQTSIYWPPLICTSPPDHVLDAGFGKVFQVDEQADNERIRTQTITKKIKDKDGNYHNVFLKECGVSSRGLEEREDMMFGLIDDKVEYKQLIFKDKGQNLFDFLKTNPDFFYFENIHYFQDIMIGVSKMHANNYVHLAIRPETIIVTDTEYTIAPETIHRRRLLLSEFGIAGEIDEVYKNESNLMLYETTHPPEFDVYTCLQETFDEMGNYDLMDKNKKKYGPHYEFLEETLDNFSQDIADKRDPNEIDKYYQSMMDTVLQKIKDKTKRVYYNLYESVEEYLDKDEKYFQDSLTAFVTKVLNYMREIKYTHANHSTLPIKSNFSNKNSYNYKTQQGTGELFFNAFFDRNDALFDYFKAIAHKSDCFAIGYLLLHTMKKGTKFQLKEYKDHFNILKKLTLDLINFNPLERININEALTQLNKIIKLNNKISPKLKPKLKPKPKPDKKTIIHPEDTNIEEVYVSISNVADCKNHNKLDVLKRVAKSKGVVSYGKKEDICVRLLKYKALHKKEDTIPITVNSSNPIYKSIEDCKSKNSLKMLKIKAETLKLPKSGTKSALCARIMK